ncbi:class I SAM-dependent DNA methyltransferase [Streptosporangium saharense]|uniref:HsdM family class I SAM-dependent methyltransferase n=1 Tax=Streptosporangium saharense TaxID=1706840 RepID=UPI00369AEC66
MSDDSAPVAITLAETARLARVGRAAVSNWRRRYDDFPEPSGGTDSSPLFALDAMESWLLRHGKIQERTGALDRLWPRFESLGDLDAIGAVIATLGARLADLPDPDPRPSTKVEQSLVGEALAAAKGQDPLAVFNYLLDRWLRVFVRQVSTTPRPLAELMSLIAADQHTGTVRRVFDPACGIGTLPLAAMERFPDAEQAGQDSDPIRCALARARLRLASPGIRVDVRAADTLLADTFSGVTADVVLCDPPTNERDWGYGELTTDPRWLYGHPPRTEPELAWVQHVVSVLAPGGTAVILLPPAVASRRAGRRIRGALLRSGVLLAVIALPLGAAPPHGIGLHLWVLQAPPEQAREDILFVDTADCRPTDSLGRQVVDWPAITQRVLAAFRKKDAEGAVRVPVIDLLDEQVDLTPARRIPASAASAATELRRSWKRLDIRLSAITELRETLSRVLPGPPAPGPPVISVAELERANAVQILTGRSIPEGLPRRSDQPGNAHAVLELNTLDNQSAWLSDLDVQEHGESLLLTEADDLVVISAARLFDLWVETRAGVVIGPQLQVVRADETVIDPWFLAACLRTPDNIRRAGGHASSSSRVDIRRLHVLRLPREEQARYGALYRKVVSLEDSLRAMSSEGALIRRTMEELISAGRFPRD